jgi:iron(III) transport system substrate-binding protein
MHKKIILFLLFFSIIAIPLIFKSDHELTLFADDTLVIISPHTEFICDEFANGFAGWYKQKTGRTVLVDIRHIGGSTETQRFLDAVYDNAFRTYWEKTLKRPWNYAVQMGYCKALPVDNTPEDDTLEVSARRAFLNSSIGCGIDILFGGGTLVFEAQAARGQLVPAFIEKIHPEWFTDAVTPLKWAGDYTRDPHGLWYGAVFSSYGILYNTDAFKKLKVNQVPDRWSLLIDPCFFGKVALTDPSKSGTAKKAFELMIQEQMYLAVEAALSHHLTYQQAVEQGVAEGWLAGLRLLQKISANARYFTDKGTKPALDVSSGDCAITPILDYYGFAQEQNILERGGVDRIRFVLPEKGTTLEPDPVALLRGAPNPKVATLFIEYLLSPEGQKIWTYQAHKPGGPQHYTLGRLPIRKDLCTPEHAPFRANPDVNPYSHPERYTYHAEWTLPIFNALHVLLKSICIDPHQELQEAWLAIIQAQKEERFEDANAALLVFEDMTGLSYPTIKGPFTDMLNEGTPLQVISTQANLTKRFTDQYRKAAFIANGVTQPHAFN